MSGKDLTTCPVCCCDPCDCHGATSVDMVTLTYYIDDASFTLHVPVRLVKQYTSLYKEVEVMNADGSVVVYIRGVVTENNDENQ